MYTTRSSIEGSLDIISAPGKPLVFSRAHGQEPVINNTITVAADAATTLTAAQLLGGIIEGPITAGRTYTTDTAANIDAAIDSPKIGDSFTVQVINTSGGANTITLAAGSGVTLKGNAAVAQNKVSYLMFLRTANTPTWNMYTSVSA